MVAFASGAFVPLALRAQRPARKVALIGYLSHTSPATDASWLRAFEQGLKDLGYVEGRNIVIERRHTAGQTEMLSALAAELVRLQPDVLVTFGGVQAIRKLSATIPIVMTVHADPVREGVIASLARPGGQVTGLSDQHGDIAPKRLELLKEISPSIVRVGVLFNPTAPVAGLAQVQDLAGAAVKLGLDLVQFPVKGIEHIDRAFAAMAKQRIGGITLIGDAVVIGLNRSRIVELALKHRLPAIGTVRTWGEQGLLMSYGTDFHDLWRRSATYVDKILKGAKAAELPVEQPTKFELVVNLRTAKALGVTVPPTILVRADRIIE